MARNLDKAVEETIHSTLLETHTMLPGIITDFDPEKQLVNVQLTIKKKYNGEVIAIPELMEVPISWPRAGGYMITFPIKEGDECLVEFFERSIDNWLLEGGVQDPENTRRHDFSDAVVHVGVWNQTNPIKEYNDTEPEFRTEDGIKKVWLSNDGWVEMVNEELDTRVVLKEDGQVRAANDKVKTSLDIYPDSKFKLANPLTKVRGRKDGNLLLENPLTHRIFTEKGKIEDKTLMAKQELERRGKRAFKNLLVKEVYSHTGNVQIKSLMSRLIMNPTGTAELGTPANKLSINRLQSSLGGLGASVKALPAAGKALLTDLTGAITPQLVLNLASVVTQMAVNMGVDYLTTTILEELNEIEDLLANVIEEELDWLPDDLTEELKLVLKEHKIDLQSKAAKEIIEKSDIVKQTWDNEQFNSLIEDTADLIDSTGGGDG